MENMKVENIDFAYGSRPILHDISFDACAGEVIGILGQNGCGKTTLLKCLNASLKAKRGDIIIDGKSLSDMTRKEIARKIAFVTQMSNITFAFTVYETVMMGRYPCSGDKCGPDADINAVYGAMKVTETLQFADRYVNELSGGERKRVMIARALAQDPEILLLDEPTSHLDINHQFDLFEMARKLAEEKNILVLIVTHDIVLASRYCDKVMIVKDGSLHMYGKTEEVLTPETIENDFFVEADVTADPRFGMNIVLVGKSHKVKMPRPPPEQE